MVTLIYGRSGAGKSSWISEQIMERMRSGKRAILLVPEQETVNAERRMTGILSDIPSVGLEVLNFSRLANRVFREAGGLSYRYIGNGAKRLIMRQAVTDVHGSLLTYKHADPQDKAWIDQMIAAVGECKRNRLTPQTLEAAAHRLSDNDSSQMHLRAKLHDCALIYSAYQALLQGTYDDPADDLTRLAEVLETYDFFTGKYVYIDGFHGFTSQQFAVLGHIFRQSASVSVTLCCTPEESERAWIFEQPLETGRRLQEMSASYKKEIRTITLRENHRAGCEMLRFLEDRIFGIHEKSFPVQDEQSHPVFICYAQNVFAEAEFIAQSILSQVRRGMRYRDIAVVTRDTVRYEGILDVMFEKYEIPYFMARRVGIMTKPLVRLITSIFSIFEYHYRRQDVISLLRTGLCPIDAEAVCLFEKYVTTWNLNGSRYTDEYAWSMNPDGYTADVSQRTEAVLRTVNAVREALIRPLEAFRLKINGKRGCTVREISLALWEYMISQQIPERLRKHADLSREYGDRAGASETERLWGITMDALDRFVDVAGDWPVSISEYAGLLDMVLSDVDIGNIPTSIDEVVIGDASRLRTDGVKIMYIVGANDGLFPKNVEDSAFFSDYEALVLRRVGIEISEDTERKTARELFFFYYAVSGASEKLILTYAEADAAGKALRPSVGVQQVVRLSGIHTVPCASLPVSLRVSGERASFELTALCKGTPLGDALLQYYKGQAGKIEAYRRWLEALEIPLSERRNRLSMETASLLFGHTVNLTQTRLETYLLCHFSYYCQYLLKLRESRRAEIGYADIGNFTHYILEQFMRLYAARTEAGKGSYSRTEIEKIVDEKLDEYIRDVLRIDNGRRGGGRLKYLFGKLRRTAVFLCSNLQKEFGQSRFQPRDFEVPVTYESEEGIPPLAVELPDGGAAYVFGKIDRVDTFIRDGVTYFRVVDYKTGVRKFSVSDIEMGLNLQMLLYLFSIWQNGGKRYGEKRMPAGVLYLSAGTPDLPLDAPVSENELEKLAEDTLKRDGLVLNDLEVIRAMDKELSRKYAPAALKKDSTFTAGSSIATLEEFKNLMRQVSETVSKITMEMKSGDADALPLHRRQPDAPQSPCEHCAMKPVCRQNLR